MGHYSPMQYLQAAWEHWNIQGAILLSLFLQTELILLAPIRKRTSTKLVIILVWLGYLLADAVAIYCVGLISNNKRKDQKTNTPETSDLHAFWAPFLLLHLGGPDTITAFALEDNELWLRHLFAFVSQGVTTAYIFIQTLPNNKLVIPTSLLFVAGIIKYLERTRALYLASVRRFRESMMKKPDPGPDYAKLMEEYASKKRGQHPPQIIMIPEPDKEIKDRRLGAQILDELEIIQEACRLFSSFRGLIVELIFSFKERDESREFFFSLSSIDTLKIIEVELNFLYDVLFTKAGVVHSWAGEIFRFLSVSSVVAALAVFRFYVNKGRFDPADIEVTYVLLFGALALEVIAMLRALFSDWTVVEIGRTLDSFDDSWWKLPHVIFMAALKLLLSKFLKVRETFWKQHETNKSYVHNLVHSFIVHQRWSAVTKSYNLITYCLKGRRRRTHEFKTWLEKNIPRIVHTKTSIKQTNIRKTIQDMKVDQSSTDGQVGSSTVVKDQTQTTDENGQKSASWAGKFVAPFRNAWQKSADRVENTLEFIGLKSMIDEMLYVRVESFTVELWEFIFHEVRNKSLFADDAETAKRASSARGEWVIQETDMKKLDFMKSPDSTSVDKASEDEYRRKLMAYIVDVSFDESVLLWHIATGLLYYMDEAGDNKYKEFSKTLSDYMLYLLIMLPSLTAAVAGNVKIIYRDTCAETKRFFKRKGLKANQYKQACEQILDVETDVKPITVKGDRSKSVLFDASMLAKDLQNLNGNKWEMLSKMWVELMCYAATNCRASAHAQHVSKGGELLTVVWLLMAHFGLGRQFQIKEGHARAKLIYGQ